MKIEQTELRDAISGLLGGLPAGADADAAWEAIRDGGWLALSAPEGVGGMEQSLSAAAALYMELGAALSPAPILPTLAAVDALTALPASQSRDALLGRLIAGEPVAASLIDGEEAHGKIKAVQGSSHLLLARPGLLALIPLSQAEVETRPLWDKSRQLSTVMPPARIEDEWILARGADAEKAIAAFSTHLHFALAADCVGASHAILDQTVAYLKTRRQFDRPIAMFQALKHRCADLKTKVEAAEALLMDYLAEVESGDGRDPLALAKGAKSIASTTFRLVAEEAIQLHGGIGMTEEHPAHLFLKRALLNEQLGTSDDACDLAVAAALLRDPSTPATEAAR